MNWQQVLTLVIVLGVTAIVVWRSSSPHKHNRDCNCGCDHDYEAGNQKQKAQR